MDIDVFRPSFSLIISSPLCCSDQNNWSQELTDRWISEKHATPEGSTFFSAACLSFSILLHRSEQLIAELHWHIWATRVPLHCVSLLFRSEVLIQRMMEIQMSTWHIPCPVDIFSIAQIILYCIIVFGWSEPIITEIEWNRYLSGIQPPFWGSFMTHLFSFHFRGADWKNLSQRLTEICPSKVLSGFLFPTHLTEIPTFCLTNNQKFSFWIRSL